MAWIISGQGGSSRPVDRQRSNSGRLWRLGLPPPQVAVTASGTHACVTYRLAWGSDVTSLAFVWHLAGSFRRAPHLGCWADWGRQAGVMMRGNWAAVSWGANA